MEIIIGVLAALFFLSQLGGLHKDNQRHQQRQRDEGTDGIWYVKADNAYSGCFEIACLIVFLVAMAMTFGGLAVGGGQ